MNAANQNASLENKSIGGWLILFLIGLLTYPASSLIVIIKDLIPALSGEIWSTLTNPAGAQYHPLWAPLLIGELVGNCFFIVFSIVLIVLLFIRRKMVPKLTITFLIANLIYVSVDIYLVRLLPAIAQNGDYQALTDWVRTLVACLIWVPYFIASKRVKTTFVK